MLSLGNVLTTFGIIFLVFFLLFMRGAGKLNAEYDKAMRDFYEKKTVA